MDSIIQYSEEIRDYLIGRIGKYTTTGEIEKTQILQNLPAPVCRWWMFEGKKYSDLNYSLASNWTKIAKAAKMLLNTFNPQWQALDVPEGHIDWPKTIRENIGRIIPVFVCDTSHLGLNPDEREALKVWINWISKEWDTYISEVGIPLNSEPIEPLYEVLSEIHGNTNMYTTSHIHRFAHIARRSRWPLLRNIIAESFRCYLETEELDKLPLPSNRETIYEMFCLDRVLR